jgi:hypothetical protein
MDVIFDRPQYFEPVDLWQFQVKDHELWRVIEGAIAVNSSAEEEFESLLAVANDVNAVAQVFFAERV